MSRKLWIGVALAAVLSAQPALALRNTEPGLAATPFSLAGQSGSALSLPDMLGQKATLVVFWASWSPRSEVALADLQEMYRKYGPVDLQVIAILADPHGGDSGEHGECPLPSLSGGIRVPVAFDSSLRVCKDWGVVAVPSVVLIDGKGHVTEVLDGYPPLLSAKIRARAVELLEGGCAATVALCPDDAVAQEETR